MDRGTSRWRWQWVRSSHSRPPNDGLIFCRNIFKLSKAKRLAQERGESSMTEILTAHERCNGLPRKQSDVQHNVVPLERKAYTEQEDWREVCLPSMSFLTH